MPCTATEQSKQSGQKTANTSLYKSIVWNGMLHVRPERYSTTFSLSLPLSYLRSWVCVCVFVVRWCVVLLSIGSLFSIKKSILHAVGSSEVLTLAPALPSYGLLITYDHTRKLFIIERAPFRSGSGWIMLLLLLEYRVGWGYSSKTAHEMEVTRSSSNFDQQGEKKHATHRRMLRGEWKREVCD